MVNNCTNAIEVILSVTEVYKILGNNFTHNTFPYAMAKCLSTSKPPLDFHKPCNELELKEVIMELILFQTAKQQKII